MLTELKIKKCTDSVSGKEIKDKVDCPNDECVFIDDGANKGCYERPPGEKAVYVKMKNVIN